MQVQINGEPRTLEGSTSIQTLLETLHVAPTGIAIAINDTVIPRSQWAKQEVNNQDDILIIRATQGG